MKAPHCVVFDLGNVLLHFDYGILVRRLAGRVRVDERALHALVSASPWLYQYERGELSSRGFFDVLRRQAGFNGSFEDFSRMFGDIFSEIPEMTAMNRRLRVRGLRTFIFSNTNPLAVEYIKGHFPFFGDFHDRILSFEHGVMKPEARLYEVVEQRTGCRGSAILFLDDRLENVEAARARGWQSFVHQTPSRSHRKFQERGLLV